MTYRKDIFFSSSMMQMAVISNKFNILKMKNTVSSLNCMSLFCICDLTRENVH